MKLELKHLSPYLPYKLKCELLNYKSDYVGEKYGIINGFYYLGGEVHYTFKDRSTAGKTRDLIKPILRPLSDFNKFTNINGVDFYPLNEIHKIFNGSIDCYKVKKMWKFNDWNTKNIQYGIFIKMIEWHFDVFGLIEKGLAIDINKLK
jgi:hypothetical protein